MKSYAKVIVAILCLFASLSYAGEVVDLGKVDKVPDWALGPLLALPMERVQDRKLVANRIETTRIGTIQINYVEVEGNRLAIEAINLSEVPNDGHRCKITTKLKNGYYFEIRLSQSLYDQTFYNVHLEKFKLGEEKGWTRSNLPFGT